VCTANPLGTCDAACSTGRPRFVRSSDPMTVGARPVDDRESTLGVATRAPQAMRESDTLQCTRAASITVPLAAGSIYALLVAVLWLPFGSKSGMGYETTLVYLSESRSFVDGFFYDWDPLRHYMQLFYQVGYQLSNVMGIDGSFLGNQLVYAALWWGRGFLTFLIIRRLFPSAPLLAYATGALVVVHASDHALNWVGQLNQFGVMFWMLLAVYLLVVALQQTTSGKTIVFTAAAAGATYLCLWSYESPLFILVLAPALLVPLVGLTRRTAAVCVAFYLIPLVFVLENLSRYVGNDAATYQESVLRDDFAPTRLMGDLVYNVRASIRFDKWGDLVPQVASSHRAMLAGLVAASVFSLGALLVSRIARRQEEQVARRELALLLSAGMMLLVASFPAYLALEGPRSLWRTQFLSGIGFGIAAAALLVLVASPLSDRRVRVLLVVVGGAVIAYAGGSTAYRTAAYHFSVWERHREAMAQVLQIAPRVRPETVIVLTNVPRGADPFGHNMWFDVALRLAYPHTAVAGLYYYRGGKPAPGANLVVHDGMWKPTETGFPTLLSGAPFSNTLIIRYSESGRPVLVKDVPSLLHAGNRAAASYDPDAAIEGREPSPLATRRYGAS